MFNQKHLHVAVAINNHRAIDHTILKKGKNVTNKHLSSCKIVLANEYLIGSYRLSVILARRSI